jgi:hypothetical protein
MSGTTLFLIQSLRYLAFIEASGVVASSIIPFTDILKHNNGHGLGIVGFSSGILPACVVGTSFSTIAYITHAVEAYRLALWIGIRAQIYRRSAPYAGGGLGDGTRPWGLVFIGMDKRIAKEVITAFHRKVSTS